MGLIHQRDVFDVAGERVGALVLPRDEFQRAVKPLHRARSSAADSSSAAVNTPARFALLVAVFVGELTQRPSASRSVNLFIVAPSASELRLHTRADWHDLVEFVILLHGEQRVPRSVELFRRPRRMPPPVGLGRRSPP